MSSIVVGADGVLPGLDATLGAHYVEVDRDHVVIELEVTAALLQPYGIVHGGVYSSLAESAASIAAATWLGDRGTTVGVSNHTNFLSAVRTGTLIATATPLHRGRSQQLWDVAITSAGKLVAKGQVRLQNLTAPS